MSSGSHKRRTWEKGKGWGWIWGENDEVGALNYLTQEKVVETLHAVKLGRIYDLGVRLSRSSFRWPGHSPLEVVTFRSPSGLRQQRDIPALTDPNNPDQVGFNSTMVMCSDHVGTQIDGLSHFTTGKDQHLYNNFREEEWGGNWGVRRADADTVPPIVARGTLIDVAAYKGVEALPSGYAITPDDLWQTLKWEKVDIEIGDVVLVRTGVLSFWGAMGEDHARLAEHDTAGITLASARWLVEEKGSIMIGADNSAVEVIRGPGDPGTPNPVHVYLLIEQGVHMGEFHNLECLSRDKVYKFAYFAVTNRIQGTTAGFALRPVAII